MFLDSYSFSLTVYRLQVGGVHAGGFSFRF